MDLTNDLLKNSRIDNDESSKIRKNIFEGRKSVLARKNDESGTLRNAPGGHFIRKMANEQRTRIWAGLPRNPEMGQGCTLVHRRKC
mgnify:CR=1 FL=1